MSRNRCVSIAKCNAYNLDKIRNSLEVLLKPLGGIKNFVSKNERVLIKPNLLSAHPPEKGVTTHPLMLQAVCELVLNAGGKPIIADSSAIPNFKSIIRKTGVQKVAEKFGIPLKEITESVEIKNPNGEFKKIQLGKDVFEVDKIINLAKLKTHNLMILTLGVKNMFGVIPGRKKAEWHLKAGFNKLLFAQLLVELYFLVKPVLTIVDAIYSMEGNGPSNGDLIKTGLIFAGKDAINVDRVISHLIGLGDNLYILKASQKYDHKPERFSDINIKGISTLDEVKISNFKLPSNIKILTSRSSFTQSIVRRLISRPKIINSKCEVCGDCFEVCPASSIYKKNNKFKIDYNKCVNCLCCQEICPWGAIKIKKKILSTILNKI